MASSLSVCSIMVVAEAWVAEDRLVQRDRENFIFPRTNCYLRLEKLNYKPSGIDKKTTLVKMFSKSLVQSHFHGTCHYYRSCEFFYFFFFLL